MVTKMALVTIGTLRIHDMDELQHVANAILRDAMTNERSKRWKKVVHSYKQLLSILNKKNFPPDVPVPSWYSMLMYETHYHLGIALQHLAEHKKAVTQYTKAIEAVFIPKNGCLAGCNSNSCLMTPLYARRAFAYARAGDYKYALRDAEKAVMLDNKNPDVYCIRSLVRSTRNEQALALHDVKRALKYNQNHLCALIVKGRLVAPQTHDEWLEPGKKDENIDHKKACSINPDCHNFLSVQDFNHNEIITFFERFLYSLSIPHTVSQVVFFNKPRPSQGHGLGQMSRVSSAKSTDSRISVQSQMSVPGSRRGSHQDISSVPSRVTLREADSTTTPSRVTLRESDSTTTPSRVTLRELDSSITPSRSVLTEHDASMTPPSRAGMREPDPHGGGKPFRCGTPAGLCKDLEVTTVQRRREYSTALREHVNRPKTAEQAIVYLEKQRLKKQFEDSRAARDVKVVPVNDTLHTRARSRSRMIKPAATEMSPQQAPQGNYNAKKISVFQEMNIKEMPRMYYRPWLGDKLPVADLDRKEWLTPPFRV